MTGQESNSTMYSGDRGGCSHNQYHVRRERGPRCGVASLSLDYPVDGGSGLRRIPRRGRPGLHETPSDWPHLPTSGLAVFRPLYTL